MLKPGVSFFLASSSAARKLLLTSIGLPFSIIPQDADEACVHPSENRAEYVLALAVLKMKHAQLPKKLSSQSVVLTADTIITAGTSQEIFGKPINQIDARRMLRFFQQEPLKLLTGHCLSFYKDGVLENQVSWVSTTKAEFVVPDERMDDYLNSSPLVLKACGATVIEGMGMLFLKNIEGSFSSAMGIDLYTLYEHLQVQGCIE